VETILNSAAICERHMLPRQTNKTLISSPQSMGYGAFGPSGNVSKRINANDKNQSYAPVYRRRA